MEDAVTSKEDDDTDSQDSNIPIDHDHLARNSSIKIRLYYWRLLLSSDIISEGSIEIVIKFDFDFDSISLLHDRRMVWRECLNVCLSV